MRKLLVTAVTAFAIAAFALPAFATNGTNIIGVGTLSRSMGGVGVAAPQDAITAVFGNPAAMCYIPCETSEVDFAATVFDPAVESTVNIGGFETKGVSQGAPYAFPAIGIYTPINDDWRFGLSAYGVSGLGVDYKDSDLGLFGFDIKTELSVMKFAPNIAYKVLDNLSVGAAIQVNYAQLDLGDGSAHDFGFGTQVGVSYQPVDFMSVGVTYQSPQKHTFKRVFNFDAPFGDLQRDTLSLEQPQQVALGIAFKGLDDMLLVEVDGKWINWSDADGYKDFDWKDQWSVSGGVQVKPVDWLALRMGYNWAQNPVKEHNGWNPAGISVVQGTITPTPLYEGFRVVGFPAIVESHLSCGMGINLSPKVSLNVGYMHAFENKISESSLGGFMKYSAKLSEDSYEFGVNIMF